MSLLILRLMDINVQNAVTFMMMIWKPLKGAVKMYETLIEWTRWFDPILRTLIGVACLKYIILDW